MRRGIAPVKLLLITSKCPGPPLALAAVGTRYARRAFSWACSVQVRCRTTGD